MQHLARTQLVSHMLTVHLIHLMHQHLTRPSPGKLRPTLLAEWDLTHVLAQLNAAKQADAASCDAPDTQRNSNFKENPDAANISEYHLGIEDEPSPAHLAFKCGNFIVTNEGVGLRGVEAAEKQQQASQKENPQLPQPWWVSSEAAAAAIKKVARLEQEERLKKERSKPEDPARGSAAQISSSAAVKKKPTLAAGNMSIGEWQFKPHARAAHAVVVRVGCLMFCPCRHGGRPGGADEDPPFSLFERSQAAAGE